MSINGLSRCIREQGQVNNIFGERQAEEKRKLLSNLRILTGNRNKNIKYSIKEKIEGERIYKDIDLFVFQCIVCGRTKEGLSKRGLSGQSNKVNCERLA